MSKTKKEIKIPNKDRSLYLEKPVTEKKKTGENNFLELVTCLFYDFKNFKSDSDYLIWYTAIAMNLYMHNSSHKPIPGYGKAQRQEKLHELYYYRSQTKHPHRHFHDSLAKNNSGKGQMSLLPRNQAFEKLVANSGISNKLSNELKKLDKRGFPKKNQKIEKYFSLFLAYSGARANNLNTYISALNEGTKDGEKINTTQLKTQRAKLKKFLPKTLPKKKIQKLTSAEVIKRINAIQSEFQNLHEKTDKFKLQNNLYTHIFKHRNNNAKEICQESQALKLKHISVETTDDTNCIYINLYPEFTDKIRESANYKEGFTNIILGFFGGLLNHKAKKRNLFIHTDRRQSFGFIRSTLADVGTMRIRLSLGIDLGIFNFIVLESLKDLDSLLDQFDFKDKTNLKVKDCFEACEKSRKKDKKVTEKTGNRMLSVMRSPHNQWFALNEAEYYLDSAKKTLDFAYLTEAFENYLNEFVVKQEIVTKLKNPTPLQKIPQEKQIQKNSKTIVSLNTLQNLVKYAVDFASALEKITENDSILSFKHSYWHSLLKLYNNCDKAIYLLNHQEEFDITHVCAKSNLLIENILEYLISLDCLEHIHQKLQNKKSDPVEELETTEKNYISRALGLNNKNIGIYFTDSGQQAITASLLAMDMQLLAEKKHKDLCNQSVFMVDHSYYELGEFLKKVGGLRNFNPKTAKIIFIDVTQVTSLDLKAFPQMQTVVIDITNNPYLNNKKLNTLIQQLHADDKWVLLVSSSLKHEELGLDKYQSGKIITLAPQGKSIAKNVDEELAAISKEAMHPLIASYLQIVNKIFREKIEPEEEELEINEEKKGKEKLEEEIDRKSKQEVKQETSENINSKNKEEAEKKLKKKPISKISDKNSIGALKKKGFAFSASHHKTDFKKNSNDKVQEGGTSYGLQKC